MGSFDAAGIVEPLDYKFAKFKGPNGTIKEPSDDQIMAFSRAMIAHERKIRKLNPASGLPDDAPYEDQLDAAEKYAADFPVTDMALAEAQIFSDLCSGKPAAEDILKLPRRIRTAFYQWLRDELMNPEVSAGGGSAQVLTLPSAPAA